VVVVWPRPRRVQVPVLVMGAEHDGFFTAAEMDRTAAAYRTEAEIIPGMGLT
jgi:pimeloyl-ACP methyl ester carboxylesterase